uniref:Uncharacterized protein n=1 Tax=Arundo donax TaxID=35708 RepID=A0A0A8YDG1_ARUDO
MLHAAARCSRRGTRLLTILFQGS